MSQVIGIRYLYDQNGNRTDVIIPISAWSEDIELIIKGKISEKEKFDPTVYNVSIEQSDRLILNSLTVDIEQSKR